MTKKNYCLITIFVSLANIALAQNPIPNAGFNNWNTVTYEVPNRWMMIGKTSRDISKTLGYVNGVRLSNDVASGTVSFAMNVGSKYPDPLTG